MEEFDDEYEIFEDGLESLIMDFEDVLDNCTQLDSSYYNREIDILQKILKQFELEDGAKQEIQLQTIRDTYLMGNTKEAEDKIDKFIKKNPSVGEGYEVKCNFELKKKRPDMEKVAEILDEADENGTFVPDEEIYDKVIEYYNEIGNIEMEEYYASLQDMAEEELYDEDFYNEFDEDDEFDIEDIEDMEEEKEEEFLNEISKIYTDNVKKDKKFEEYLDEDIENSLLLFGPQILMGFYCDKKEIKKDPKKFVLENYKNILKNNIKYLDEQRIKTIKELPNKNYVEIKLDKVTNEKIEEISKYSLLRQLKIAFMQFKNRKILISVPLIKELKEYVENNEIMKENAKFNEKINTIVGMCQAYGAIEKNKAYSIMKKIYDDIDEEEFEKILLLVAIMYSKIDISVKKSQGKIEFIYHILLDVDTGKEISNSKEELKIYSKEEYIKYGKYDYLEKTKGYNTIKNEFESKLFFGKEMFKIIDDIIEPFSVEARIDNSVNNEMLDEIIDQIKEINKLGVGVINIKKVKDGFKELIEELPKWANINIENEK